MIGGGPGSMIGDIHRLSATFLERAQLVAGVFSSDFQKSLKKAEELGLDKSRVYKSVEELIREEMKYSKEEQIDFVSIVTPNYLHADAARKLLKAGFHVMCDKPLTVNLEEALKVKKMVEETNLIFGMTYTYRGYAAILELARQVRNGKVGKVKKVLVDYSQGWLAQLVEREGNKQAEWRTDPKYSGAGGTIADIGTHAFNMAEYVVNSKAIELAADVSILVDDRKIDDDANMLLHFENGARGVVSVGQALAGEENSFSVKIYGDKGCLMWEHEKPAQLIFKSMDLEETQEIDELRVDLNKIKNILPDGHPESFLKAFIYIYDQFIDHIKTGKDTKHPNIEDGVRGMLFIEKALKSSKTRTWESL